MRLRHIKIVSTLLIILIKNIPGNVENTNLHSTGQVGLCESYSVNTLGFSVVTFSVKGTFAYDKHLVANLETLEGEYQKVSTPYAILYDVSPLIAFGITDYLDILLSQPLYFDILEGYLPEGGVGDLFCAIKCRLPGNGVHGVSNAILTAFTIPYPDNGNGYFLRHMYFIPENNKDTWISKPVAFHSAQLPSLSIVAIGTLNKSPFEFNVNFGSCFTFNKVLDNAIIGAVGVVIHPSEWLGAFMDFYCEPRFSSISEHHTITRDPCHLSSGITITAEGGSSFSIGGTFRLSSDKVMLHYFDNNNKLLFHSHIEPFWKAFVQLSWGGKFIKRDRDNDGIFDKSDECPDIPEDFDGFNDNDGCPDNDNDQDKIPDESDSCKNIAEDIDGYEDVDGCPDKDNDKDGIPDALDQCPDISEDKDGFHDGDGCPEFDNDNDNIPDSIDKCIMIPEDKDGFDDSDGCADIDNDLDGIPDSSDHCPDSTGIPENNGCPKIVEKSKEIKFGRLILPAVHFKGNTAELTTGSTVDLDRLFHSLYDWPEVMVEIQVHTDNSIKSQDALSLSRKRAETVIAYLINMGIDASRLKAVGKGSSSPLADNMTYDGRRINNRVEIHRIEKRK